MNKYYKHELKKLHVRQLDYVEILKEADLWEHLKERWEDKIESARIAEVETKSKQVKSPNSAQLMQMYPEGQPIPSLDLEKLKEI